MWGILITEIRLENFQGIGSLQTIPLRPLTLIYGANSTGKSSLIRALLLAKQSLGKNGSREEDLQFEFVGSDVDLGGFDNVVHKHNRRNQIRIGLTLDNVVADFWLGPNGQTRRMTIENKRGELKPNANLTRFDEPYTLKLARQSDSSHWHLENISDLITLDLFGIPARRAGRIPAARRQAEEQGSRDRQSEWEKFLNYLSMNPIPESSWKLDTESLRYFGSLTNLQQLRRMPLEKIKLKR